MNVEEKFDLATNHLESLVEMAKDVKALGTYGESEQTAFALLILSLQRVQRILDEPRAREWENAQIAKYGENAYEAKVPDEDKFRGGLYL